MTSLPADFRVELVVCGAPRGLKNSKIPRIIRPKQGARGPFRCPCCKNGLHVLLPLSPPAAEWRRDAVPQLKAQWPYSEPLPKWVRVNVCIISYMPTLRLPDSDNLLSGPLDAMTAAEIWEDDVVVASFDGSRRRYDKDNPRVEITITPAAPDLEDRGRQPGLFDGKVENRVD